jgi:hypothetical protein
MSEERSSILLLPIHAPCYPARNSPIICKAVGVDVTSKLIMVREKDVKNLFPTISQNRNRRRQGCSTP